MPCFVFYYLFFLFFVVCTFDVYDIWLEKSVEGGCIFVMSWEE